MKSSKFIRSEKDMDVFHFVCPGCGSEGELKVPRAMQPFGCPEGCGATFLWWKPATIPQLKCVVCPVYAKAEDSHLESAYDDGVAGGGEAGAE